MQQKTRQIIVHVLGSIGFLSLPVLFSPDLTNPIGLFHVVGFQKDFTAFVLLYLFFYLNYLVLLPEYFFKKKYFSYVILLLICYSIIIVIPQQLSCFNMSYPFPHDQAVVSGAITHLDSHKRFFMHDLNSRLFQFLLVFTFSLLLKTNMRLKQSEKEKTNAELSYLKAQINPHFLFNTLNSIYSLALNKSDETATAVVKLSGMMRYVLSESSQDFVSLEKEINYVGNYIELQKLRLEDTVKVEYTLTGTAIGKKIAPLILIPFVENAFKHGVNPEEDSHIIIDVSVEESKVHLKVVNNKVNNTQDNNHRNGLGIENVKSRLQLLYPAKHLLLIDDNEKYYSVYLTINPL